MAKAPRIDDIVEYMGKNAVPFAVKSANKVLKVGQRYRVVRIFADDWGCYLYLDGIQNKSFRSEMFAYVGRHEEKKVPQ